MTNQNNAAQSVLTDDEILQVFADAVGNQEDDARFIDVDRDQAIRIARTLLSALRAPVADERIGLRGAANLAFNALHECKPAKGAEKQYSDAIQALQSALHDIAYTVNRTATPQQFAEHLQREARAALASAPVAGEACKRCGGPGWYASHTTGYPESIPCSACNPQGVSVGRLEKDPFLAAQLWRKPANFADAYEGAREDLAIWKRRALEAESDLRAERETSSRLIAELNAQNGPMHMGEPAPQASEAVRDARGVLEAWQAVCDRIVDQYGGVVAGVDFAALGRTNRAALSAQPAEKPATSAPSPATSQRQAMIPASRESGNSHTDGGAVYA